MAKTTINRVGAVPTQQHPRSVVAPRCQRVQTDKNKETVWRKTK